MQAIGKRVRPRCAQCGSADILLEGQASWHYLTQRWVMRAPRTYEDDGIHRPVDETSGFYCTDCGANVGIFKEPR